MPKEKTLNNITEELNRWIPGLDVGMPIHVEDIAGFHKWVNWNCFREEGRNGLGMHRAYDFAAYMNDQRECVLGLPPETPVRSIADGIALFIHCDVLPKKSPKAYYRRLIIKHNSTGLVSEYLHVVPTVKVGQTVTKGDVIATVYKTPKKFLKKGDSLVHLHFGLGTCLYVCDLDACITGRLDPRKILPKKSDLYARPQNSLEFRIARLRRKVSIVIANNYKEYVA